MPLDEPSLRLLKQLADSGAKPFHQMQPREARAFLSTLRPAYGDGPTMLKVEEHTVIKGETGFRLRVLVPEERPSGLILYCHGGGWATMSIEDFDTFGRLLASKTRCAVVLVDYRLAPEHRYPAAVDDCWLALQWTAAQRARITGSAEAPLVVSGDSAGANLAAVLAQRSVRLGGPRLALQVLAYPVLQADLDGPSYLDPANQLLLCREDMAWFWDQYLPDRTKRGVLDASPLAATALSGLPPTLIVSAEYDILREEGETYARLLQEAGVPVTERCFEGQMHTFFTMVNVLPASALAIDYVSEWISRRLSQARLESPQLVV